VELAILGDPGLTERQKQTLLDVYSAFLAKNTSMKVGRAGDSNPTDPEAPGQPH